MPGPLPLPVPRQLGDAIKATRMGVGLAGLPTAATAGAAAGLLRGGKRGGIDAVLGSWLDWYLAAGGVTREVVAGEEYLEAPRPAVFIFNHKNLWEPLVLASLIRTSFTGVGKKELQKDPFMNAAGRLIDLAFVDRSGNTSAAEQLKPMEELARKGLSVIVAPEGTRSKTGELGAFKKGAFRIAMATGLPIISVVFRNAEILGSSSSRLMGSGHIQARVLPPVSTEDWTLEDLPERIDEVRNQFVEVLADWPGPPSMPTPTRG